MGRPAGAADGLWWGPLLAFLAFFHLLPKPCANQKNKRNILKAQSRDSALARPLL